MIALLGKIVVEITWNLTVSFSQCLSCWRHCVLPITIFHYILPDEPCVQEPTGEWLLLFYREKPRSFSGSSGERLEVSFQLQAGTFIINSWFARTGWGIKYSWEPPHLLLPLSCSSAVSWQVCSFPSSSLEWLSKALVQGLLGLCTGEHLLRFIHCSQHRSSTETLPGVRSSSPSGVEQVKFTAWIWQVRRLPRDKWVGRAEPCVRWLFPVGAQGRSLW